MADSQFFHKSEPLSLRAIVSLTGAKIVTSGNRAVDDSRTFKDVAALDMADADEISFLDNQKYLDAFVGSAAGACFVRSKFVNRAPKPMILLVTEEPYYAYALTAQAFYSTPVVVAGISPQAHIAKTASVGKGSRIDAGVVLGERVRIGERCWIEANTVIDMGVAIGDDCRIGPCCTISHSLLGHRILIHRGVHIGQDGFGFAPGPKGLTKVPQLGRVRIEDDVEIGSGTCIDRGAGPDTVIGAGTKIDNLVQIGHNVQIGKHAILVAQCGISGSSRIGDGVMLGGQVGIAGHLHIGTQAKLAAQSGVAYDIPPQTTYGGSPAVPIKDWHRQTAILARLIKKKGSADE